MNILETVQYYFQLLWEYLFGKEADEYKEYEDRKISMENPLHTSRFEAHHIYPCKDTF